LWFDSPGRYRVTVASRRVSDAPGDTSFYQGVVQDLKSNSIDLEIVAPESAWQEEQLKKILIDLDQPPRSQDHF
jgi:hypothetical protein